MGEIADDMIKGACCALCSQYFIKSNVIDTGKNEIMSGEEFFEHGYPVACKECWEPGCGYERATANTI